MVVVSVVELNEILGNNTPLLELEISKIEDGVGFVVPIPTCAFTLSKEKVSRMKK